MSKYVENRFLPASFEIHWLSIINSIVLVLLLTAFLVIIFIRVLKDDLSRYMDIEVPLEFLLSPDPWSQHARAFCDGGEISPSHFVAARYEERRVKDVRDGGLAQALAHHGRVGDGGPLMDFGGKDENYDQIDGMNEMKWRGHSLVRSQQAI